jgi:hypothetical protein
MKNIMCIAVLFISLGALAQANQQGVMVRQATVYADASSAAQAVGIIKAGDRVSVFGRKGGRMEGDFFRKEGDHRLGTRLPGA